MSTIEEASSSSKVSESTVHRPVADTQRTDRSSTQPLSLPPHFGLYTMGVSNPYFFDSNFATLPHPPFADRFPFPLDFNIRRKNATKETTSALKAWLNEHNKNPYPTKSEKVMLAFLTRMTLTQVSTWFANARRRLKKENKMTWAPRTCCGKNDENCRSKKVVADSSSHAADASTDSITSDDDDSDNDDDSQANRKRHTSDHNDTNSGCCKKPKIWSIVETVQKTPTAPDSTQLSPYHFVFPPWPRMPTGSQMTNETQLLNGTGIPTARSSFVQSDLLYSQIGSKMSKQASSFSACKPEVDCDESVSSSSSSTVQKKQNDM